MGLGSRTPVCVIVLVFAALVSLSPTEASAQSRVCRNLQAQLSALPRGGGGGNAAAVAQLKRELAQARRTANQKRCGALFGKRSAECKAINASIQSMTGKLASLQGAGGGSERKRQQLQAALRNNGCNKPQRSKRPQKSQKTKQAAKPNPQAAKPKATAARSASTPNSTSRSKPKAKKSSRKTFRTMCVRLCDGYYFPISFSVPEKLFDRDAETCQARCPGTEVSLYVHKPGEESENMISYRDDEPYRELDTAFSYRRTRARENSCGCSPAPGDSEQASVIPEPSMEETGAITRIPIPTPSPRRERQRDGESVDAESETGTGGIKQAAAASGMPASPAEERRVRVVGPKFLPDPSEVIDLRDPDRLPVR